MLIKKIPHASGLVTTTVSNTKINGLVKKRDYDKINKYIVTQELYKLTAENFKERLKQADSVNKTGYDNKLISLNEKITSNKTKYLEVQKKQN